MQFCVHVSSDPVPKVYDQRHTVLMEKVQKTAIRTINVRAESRKVVEVIQEGWRVILAGVELGTMRWEE